MRKGGRVFILLGVTLALVAAVLAIFAFSGTTDDEDEVAEQVRTIEIVEATHDIPANHVLTEDDITIVEADEDTVSSGTARTPGQVLGLATSGDIVSGQRVLMANLETPGLSHVVSDGMRAVAVPIDRINALGGMIRAEDHIDVIYSIAFDIEDFYEALRELIEDFDVPMETDEEGQPVGPALPPWYSDVEGLPAPFEPGSLVSVRTSDGNEPVTKIMLQNLRVVRVVAGDVTVDHDGELVAVDQIQASNEDDDDEEDENDTQPDTTDPDRLPSADMLILEVDPASAELIKFILDYEGQFQVALRGPDDDEVVDTPGMTFRQMIEDLGMPMPRPAEVPEDVEE